MQATLNFTTKLLAYGDSTVSSNPRLRFVDWTRDVSGIPVSDPKSESHRIDPGQSLSVFSGTRSTTIDGTSAFSLALLSVENASTYRITNTAGTAPGFRTARAVAVGGVQLVFTVNANGTLGVAAAAAIFGSVVAGDHVFIPHTTTGDAANEISVLNAGYWVVLGVTDTQNITLVRPTGEDFEGVGETVTPTINGRFKVYSAAGVQIGDGMDITAGFSAAAQKIFTVTAVTDSFVEFVSSSPLPTQTGILPGAAGLSFYSESKRLVYVEATQEVVVRINGDVGNYQRTEPFDPSDSTKPGFYFRTGPTWSLTLYNRSSVAVDATILMVE